MVQNKLFCRNFRWLRIIKVVVVIIDGSFMDDVVVFLNVLKVCGVRIYCVGVGWYINGCQLDIMFFLFCKNYIFIVDWIYLGIVVNEFRNVICLGRFNLNLFFRNMLNSVNSEKFFINNKSVWY